MKDETVLLEIRKKRGDPKWGLLMVKNRISRLGKLYDLNAPNLILAREAILILEAIEFTSPGTIAEAQKSFGGEEI